MLEVNAAAPSEEESFRIALVAAIPSLRAFAYSMTRDDAEADDLAQQALANAWAARAQFKPGTYFKAWLFRIARNVFLGGKRRSWRQVRLEQSTAEETLLAHDDTSAAVELNEIRHALAELPDEQRESLVLVWAGGFSYEEAAEIGGVAIGTIKSRVSRGKVALMRILDQGRPKRDGKPALAALSTLLEEVDRRSGGKAGSGQAPQILQFRAAVRPARNAAGRVAARRAGSAPGAICGS